MSKFQRTMPADGTALLRRVEGLERELRAIRSARRLEAATIGSGGLTVKGGAVDVRDEGQIRWFDAADSARFTVGRVEGTDHVNITYSDGSGPERAIVGEFTDEGSTEHGVLVQDNGGAGILAADGRGVFLGAPGPGGGRTVLIGRDDLDDATRPGTSARRWARSPGAARRTGTGSTSLARTAGTRSTWATALSAGTVAGTSLSTSPPRAGRRP
jgi:hypothetical protein